MEPTTEAPSPFAKLKTNIGRYTEIDNTQMMIILGIAISGMASIINLYDATTGYTLKQDECKESDSLKKATTVRFAMLLVISILIMGLGMYMVYKPDSNRTMALGLVIAGLFGFLYALSSGIRGAQSPIKTILSLGTFVFFVVYGYFNQKSA